MYSTEVGLSAWDSWHGNLDFVELVTMNFVPRP